MSPSARVALVRCPDYQPEKVEAAMVRGLDLLGGAAHFFRRNDKLLLKPNLLSAAPPEKAVTTHPAVFAALGRLALDQGCRLSYGDSPARYSQSAAAEKSGIAAEARRLQIPAADFSRPVTLANPGGLLLKQLTLAAAVLENDSLINICKLKTHAFTRITGAVKNLLGCVPGLLKADWHVRMPRIEHFGAGLVDLAVRLKPRLHVMDGILAMEGNGPSGGSPRQMGVLLLSTDPLALDSVFCRLIGLNPEFVPTMKPGLAAGLGTYLPEEIEVLGDPPDELRADDFLVVRRPAERAIQSHFMPSFLQALLSPRPLIDQNACTRCGVCVSACPVEPRALFRDLPDQLPQFSSRHCIRCYCCQENCPEGAISVYRPLLARLIHR